MLPFCHSTIEKVDPSSVCGFDSGTGFPSDILSRSSQAHQQNSSGNRKLKAASRHLNSNGTGSVRTMSIDKQREAVVAYRCL